MPGQAQSEKSSTRCEQPVGWPAIVLAIFGGTLLLAGLRLFLPLWENSAWPDAALLMLAIAATLAALAKQLPVLNVIIAATIASGLGGMAHAVNDVTGFPFGKFEFTPALGPRLLGVLPLAIPAFWAIAALNSRGVARLLLHNSRTHPRHGHHVLALSGLLMLAFHLALEPFAVNVKGWWTLNPTPMLAAFSWILLSLLIQVAMTPLLLDKFPGPRPRNILPLLVWVGINALMTTAILCGIQPR